MKSLYKCCYVILKTPAQNYIKHGTSYNPGCSGDIFECAVGRSQAQRTVHENGDLLEKVSVDFYCISSKEANGEMIRKICAQAANGA